MAEENIDLVPDDHSGHRERIEQLLSEAARREKKLINMVGQLEKKLDYLNRSLPISEEERVKNRFIRMYAMNGTTAPFFSPHKPSMIKK